MNRCSCLTLCLCPESWEYMRQLLGYTRQEMDAKLARARDTQRWCREMLR